MAPTRVPIKMSACLFMVFFMQRYTLAFKINSIFTRQDPESKRHEDITRDAILNVTTGVCRVQALLQGRDFVQPVTLTENSVAAACSSPDSAKGFKSSIQKITDNNVRVDKYFFLSAKHHFDNERFLDGRDLITEGVTAVKAFLKQQSYEAARQALGKALHTLQDFYSHSNWVEMGKNEPYSNLIRPDTKIENIVDNTTATCRSCNGDDCTANILEEINKQQKLTSGYFSLFGIKPAGKCSHGNFGDLGSLISPTGGINKDSRASSHGHLHGKAAQLATAATRQLLEDIRAVYGDLEFLRLVGLSQGLVLTFVIDTTGSMSNDIDAVKEVTKSIIDRRRGTANQPSEYILVPFNDPDFGPLSRTTNAEVFKKQLNALTAHGGDDEPEMCLSGLQLALTGSPPKTEMFVFTDASAKDKELKGTILALIESTKSVVNFMLTNALSARRRRSTVTSTLNQVYRELAQASGGQAIEVTKGKLPQANSIIVDTSRSSMVTLFQSVLNPGKAEVFSVFVDSSLQNLTVFITGQGVSYTITSPTGVSQNNTESNGTLGTIQKVGNFHTVRPNISDQTGLWLFSLNSTEPYSIKVVGQSAVDFLFDFIEISQEPSPSYSVLSSRPAANSNITLLVSLLGGDSVSLTGVALIEASSSKSFNGTLYQVSTDQYFVTIDGFPAGQFAVRVTGQNGLTRSSNDIFQRQSSTQFQTSDVSITAETTSTMEPGKNFTLPFTVTTSGSGRNFDIRVTNDRSFVTTSPSSVTLETGGSVNGTVTLLAPANTPSGTDVTVTIEAGAPGGSDTNYAVLRLAVIVPVTDLTPPVCELVSVNANCSSNCTLSSWDLSANMTDGNGTGIKSVKVRQGTGFLNTTTVLSDNGVNVTLAAYNASCCSPDVELVMVDGAGNVGTCFRSVRSVTDSTPPVCEIVSIKSNCSRNCSLSSWVLSANMTDGNGTGIKSVGVRQGSGSLNTTTVLGDNGVSVTLAVYSASCCSQEVELVMVDAMGNNGSCFGSVKAVTDFTPPVCEIVSVNANCSSNCTLSSWVLSANMTDGNGTGIKSVGVRQGNGSLSTTTVLGNNVVNVTLAVYSASCCSPEVELVMEDGVGNIGSCFRSVKSASASTGEELFLFRAACFWFNVAILLFYQFTQF